MLVPVMMLFAAQAAVPPADGAKALDPNEKVCRTVHEIYSRIPERECRTRAQWDRMARDTELDLRNSSKNRSSASQGAGQ